MGEIRLAIVGVGNCASALIQGIAYYRDGRPPIGLIHEQLGGYRISDVRVVAAFDIDRRKVGRDVAEAIFAKPNCTTVFCGDVARSGVTVQMGRPLDGVAPHMLEQPEDRSFRVADAKPCDVVEELKRSKAEILINYLPVGSEEAVKFYARCALDAGIGFINCMPVFIASHPEWAEQFARRGIPCVGDDIKSQLGATITHRVLTRLFEERGVRLDRTYQLNTGGNTDFLNMKEQSRLTTKRISKTEAVQSQLATPLAAENIHIGPSDYVPWQKDNKVCFIRMEGRKFGDVPLEIELRLSVEDSPNSAGVAIDAIRCAKLALDRKIGGPLTSASACLMKHPPEQFSDHDARERLEQFISGKRER
ncbi:Inositol-3-phosphate synthase [Phycisphaerae bacterium RAS1]|nr:Inositol-3-phosphate synthase [Phycisphaerae bacterium RAS1]